MPWEPERELWLRFQIDTNRINARGRLEIMNRLEMWEHEGLIEILLSEPAYDEVLVGNDARRTSKAHGYIQSGTLTSSPEEFAMLGRIESAIFPDGVHDPGQRRDVEIVFNASKYGAYLVTADGASRRQPGGILGAATALRELGIHVLTDEAACELVRSKLLDRDREAQKWAQSNGRPVPGWVGSDR